VNARRTLLLLASVVLTACRPTPTTSGPLPHDVYVWQRAWTPEVRTGLAQAKNAMGEFVVLAAHINIGKGKPVEPAIDYAALRATGKPIGLAIRIEPYFGEFREDDATIRGIVEVARVRLAQARASGIQPRELQIDFDCATSKLEGYRRWIRTLRKAVAPLPVCPTALPNWLDRPDFALLAEECGSFVLQVHCVTPPREVQDTSRLTDANDAARWVEQAAKLEVPFRVALPTYTYLVAFNARGKPIGVAAEGLHAAWPGAEEIVRWEAEPAELAGLIARWMRSRPLMLRGVIWYRLPVASDALNWRWTTLAAVMEGRAPLRQLTVNASPAQTSDIELINEGEQDEPLPERIIATWTSGRMDGTDALAGYKTEVEIGRVTFVRQPGESLSRLPPGARRPIGWVRCEPAATIRVTPAPAAAATPGVRDGY